MTQRLVAVTGATGFLGRHLTYRLNAAGWRVRVLARREPDPALWNGTTPDVLLGDIADTQALERLMAGADAVVHAAGLIKARSRQAFFAVNEAGARNVAIAAGGRRLIQISSITAREPGLSDYAASKRAGEIAVTAISPLTTIVRPPAIYGPGDRETLTLFKAAGLPVICVPGSVDARFAIAEVDDVACVITDLIDQAPSGATLTIGGDQPEGYGWRDVVAAAARAVGGRPLIVGAPTWLLQAAGATSEIFGRLRRESPIFTRGKAAEALHADWTVSLVEQGVTSGRTYTPLAEGFARTVAWYRANGWLP